jgi:hypothetical protein
MAAVSYLDRITSLGSEHLGYKSYQRCDRELSGLDALSRWSHVAREWLAKELNRRQSGFQIRVPCPALEMGRKTGGQRKENYHEIHDSKSADSGRCQQVDPVEGSRSHRWRPGRPHCRLEHIARSEVTPTTRGADGQCLFRTSARIELLWRLRAFGANASVLHLGLKGHRTEKGTL